MQELVIGKSVVLEINKRAVDGTVQPAEIDRIYCREGDGSSSRVECEVDGNKVTVTAIGLGRARIDVISKHTDPAADCFDFMVVHDPEDETTAPPEHSLVSVVYPNAPVAEPEAEAEPST